MMRYVHLLILSLLSIVELQAGSFISISLNHYYPVLRYVEESDSGFYSSITLKDTLSKIYSDVAIVKSEDDYRIQLGAFRNKSNADSLYKKIKQMYGIDARIIVEDSLFKVRISGSPESNETDQNNPEELAGGVMLGYQDSIKSDHEVISPFFSDTLMQSILFSGTANVIKHAKAAAGKIFFIKGNSPWLIKFRYFGKSFALVNALIITIMFSTSSMIILLVIILLNRNRMEKMERLHQYLLEKYQSLIIDYLFGNAGPDEFRSIASDNYIRQVLIDQMIDLSANLKGDESKKLLGLYKHLGLDRDSISRAHDYRWHKKIKGFRELAFMDIKDANEAMYKALNSSNELLRMEAQIALVGLSDDNHFEFLSHLTRPFSLWEQITLHDLIIQHDIPPPSFKQWLSSVNYTVVLFALRMIREFKQTDAEEEIKNSFQHPSPEVRLLAVRIAGDMLMSSTLKMMRHMYKNEGYHICLEIVRSMGKMPDVSMMGFLKLVLDKEDDVQLQIEATKAIENMGEEGVKTLVKLMKSEYKNYNIIVRHVLDHRIY